MAIRGVNTLEALDHSGGAVPDSHRIPCSPVPAGCRAGHQHTKTRFHAKVPRKLRQVSTALGGLKSEPGQVTFGSDRARRRSVQPGENAELIHAC